MTAVVILVSACLLAVASIAAANGLAECGGSDCITPYVWSQTTVSCTLETKSATRDCRWPSGFNARIDEKVYGGRIIAYQVQWSTSSWSDWFVPGMNDLDAKFNPSYALLSCVASYPYLANSLRRSWAYFYDHTHNIIICR